MKKFLSLLLTIALVLSTLAGCGGDSSSSSGSVSSSGSGAQSAPDPGSASSDSYQLPNLTVLSGPTGVGAAKLMADADAVTEEAIAAGEANPVVDQVVVAASNDEVTTALVNGTTDIAAIATNAAANLYAKTEGAIQVLAVNTLGVLYILEKGDTVRSMADLAGKTLYAPSNTKGANPEHILNYLLERNGVDPAEVDIQWLTPQEITVQMTASAAGICMLPVPAATSLLLQDSGVRQALSLSEEWDALGAGPLPMGCLVARTDYIAEHPQEVEDFLEAYGASIEFMADPANLDQAAALAAQYGITPSEAVAAAAIPQCNLTFLTGQEMHSVLESYYTVLFQAAPDSIGGGLPSDSVDEGVAAAAIPQCNLTFLTGQEMHTVLESYYAVLFQAAPDSIGGGLPYDSFYYGVG